jgi:hypothetical protein
MDLEWFKSGKREEVRFMKIITLIGILLSSFTAFAISQTFTLSGTRIKSPEPSIFNEQHNLQINCVHKDGGFGFKASFKNADGLIKKPDCRDISLEVGNTLCEEHNVFGQADIHFIGCGS